MVTKKPLIIALAMLLSLAPLQGTTSTPVFHDRFEYGCFAVDGSRAGLHWQADSFQEGGVLTLNTDGSCAFGELGPELIILMDYTQMEPGDIDFDHVVLCDDCSLVGGDSHQIELVDELPGGRGLVMGAIGDALNPTSTPRIRVSHPAYTRGFDSRTTYWPEEHQLQAMSYLLGEVPGYEGSGTWQIKPIWKMADGDYGGGDTDFFIPGPNRWYSPGEYFLGGRVVSSNSVGTYYLPNHGKPLQRPRSEYGMPFPEPYVIEYGWDQGSLSEAYDAFVEVNISTAEQGLLYKHREDDIRLHVVDGPVKMVDHFTYPGYIRGYSRTLGLHLYEAELYKTGGPGAFARVAISDDPDYFEARRRTLLEPISWSNGQVQVRLRDGWFDLSQPNGLYINILNADNEQVGSIRL